MSSTPVAQLVCVNPGCEVAGLATSSHHCGRCGQLTRRVDEPGLVISQRTPQPARLAPKVRTGMEIGSRIFYGGFWLLVTVAAAIAGFGLLGDGKAGGLLSLIFATLTGIYAVYIFRGGRWRIMFW